VPTLSSLLIAAGGLAYGAAALAEPIVLYYEERAPYQVRAGDDVGGSVAGPAAQAFRAAHVDFVWEGSSIGRQVHMLRENQGARCVVGWYKTSERLAFAKFTKPIYRNGPAVALVRRQFAIGPVAGVEDALSAPGLRLLVRKKYSYGVYVDSALQRIRPDTFVSSLPNSQMAEQLVENRADMMFASEEEAQVLLRHLGPKADRLQVLHFSKPLPGLERHIACSRNVPDEIIERLNSVITFK
jgi:polar amino acid transport system substrate-binding protein